MPAFKRSNNLHTTALLLLQPLESKRLRRWTQNGKIEQGNGIKIQIPIKLGTLPSYEDFFMHFSLGICLPSYLPA